MIMIEFSHAKEEPEYISCILHRETDQKDNLFS